MIDIIDQINLNNTNNQDIFHVILLYQQINMKASDLNEMKEGNGNADKININLLCQAKFANKIAKVGNVMTSKNSSSFLLYG
jgi:hypothetical protein